MLVGEKGLSVVAEYGVPEETLRWWKTQGRMDAGFAEGGISFEGQPLRKVQRRIKALEGGLALGEAVGETYDARVD